MYGSLTSNPKLPDPLHTDIGRSPSHEMQLVWTSDKGDDPAKKRRKTKAIDTVAGEVSVSRIQ